MTIRQLSDAAGCSINTVRTVARTMYPDVKAAGRGLAIDYNKEQSTRIMEKLPKKNFISDPSNIGIPTPTKTEGIDYEIIGKMISIAVSVAINQAMPALIESVKPKKQLLAPPKPSRKELNRVIGNYASYNFDGDRREAWGILYEELYDRVGKSVRVLAKNRGVSKIDIIEDLGLIDISISIINELLGLS